MKVKVLNHLLTSEQVRGARFPFPPITLPTDDTGRICAPERATKAHYVTLVLLSDDNNAPAIFEFSKDIFDGLGAYAKRHNGLSGLEILLSRESGDGKVRLRVGATYPSSEETIILASSYQNIYDSLYDKYMTKIGRQLNDIN